MGKAQLLDPVTHALGKHQRIVEAGVSQGNDKFLATVASHEIGIALHHSQRDTGHFFQALIPGRVAIGIVVLFEKIDVEQHQGDTLRRIRVVLIQLVIEVAQAAFHSPAVDTAGHAVDGGLVFQYQIGGV